MMKNLPPDDYYSTANETYILGKACTEFMAADPDCLTRKMNVATLVDFLMSHKDVEHLTNKRAVH